MSLSPALPHPRGADLPTQVIHVRWTTQPGTPSGGSWLSPQQTTGNALTPTRQGDPSPHKGPPLPKTVLGLPERLTSDSPAGESVNFPFFPFMG